MASALPRPPEGGGGALNSTVIKKRTVFCGFPKELFKERVRQTNTVNPDILGFLALPKKVLLSKCKNKFSSSRLNLFFLII